MTALGNCELAWPCRICARIWSVFGSVLTSKSTVSFIEPLLALSEYMYSMLSTPDICCSMGMATDCSDGERVRAGIGGVHLDLRVGDVGELRDGQAGHRDQAHDHHEDGDDHRHDGAVDEEFCHRSGGAEGAEWHRAPVMASSPACGGGRLRLPASSPNGTGFTTAPRALSGCLRPPPGRRPSTSL